MRNMITWKNGVLAIFGMLLFGLTGQMITSCGPAKSGEDLADVALGEELYISYCKICHGESGDGPMAEMQDLPKVDLSLISARQGGEFPTEEVTMIIDGRKPIEGHATPDMPSWSETFKNSEGAETDEEVQEKIDQLVAYLKSIQREG